jgi:hypothetical protein
MHMGGLDFIEFHIDPTDFIAFNLYQKNLHKFINFALNTENPANPWIVVNTADRYAARKQLLRVFQAQLDSFNPRKGFCSHICSRLGIRSQPEQRDTPGLEISDMVDKAFNRRMRPRTLLLLMGLLVLVWYYVSHTKFGDSVFGKLTWLPDEGND